MLSRRSRFTHISLPWIWKGVSATWQSGRYALSYPRGRFVHVADAFYKGHIKVAIRTVDTDVVVIAVAAFKVFSPQELWVAFATGSNFRFIAVHKIVDAMGPEKSAVLPIFHAFTGCDTVFGLSGRGKKTAWEVSVVYPEATETFKDLSTTHNISEKVSELLRNSSYWCTIERGVALMTYKMQPRRRCSQKNQNQLRISLQQMHPSKNTQNVPVCKVKHGSRRLVLSNVCQIQRTVAGQKTRMAGDHAGHTFREPHNSAMNVSTADVRHHIQDGADVQKQNWNVPPSVHAQGTAMTSKLGWSLFDANLSVPFNVSLASCWG